MLRSVPEDGRPPRHAAGDNRQQQQQVANPQQLVAMQRALLASQFHQVSRGHPQKRSRRVQRTCGSNHEDAGEM
jgi:hypothetical protein